MTSLQRVSLIAVIGALSSIPGCHRAKQTLTTDASINASSADAGEGREKPDADASDAAKPAEAGVPRRCPFDLDGLQEPTTVWQTSWEQSIRDPACDDTGDGDYAYPADVPAANAADVLGFTLGYSADKAQLYGSVQVRNLTPFTRVGVLLMGAERFDAEVKSDRCSFALSGVELKFPTYDQAAISFILADDHLSLYDQTLYSPFPRADNAIYVSSSVAFLACNGDAVYDDALHVNPNGVGALEVTSTPCLAAACRANTCGLEPFIADAGSARAADDAGPGRDASDDADAGRLLWDASPEAGATASARTPGEMRFTLPIKLVAKYLGISSGGTIKLTGDLRAVVYSFVLSPGPVNEFGAHEVTTVEGGSPKPPPPHNSDDWYEPDVYDLIATDGSSQSQLLTPDAIGDGSADEFVVKLQTVGEGVWAIETSGVGEAM